MKYFPPPKMKLDSTILQTIILYFLFFPGFSIIQSPDLSARQGQNVTLECRQLDTSYNAMYWFRQRPSESLEFIVYFYVNNQQLEEKLKQKVSARKHGKSLDLTVTDLQSTDSAVYFCAKQDAQQDNLITNLYKNCTTPTTRIYTTPANCSTQTQ